MKKKILCYGDSNTFGLKPLNFDLLEKDVIISNLRFSEEMRWTGVLQSELGKDYKIIEEGLCGRTTVLDDPVEGHHMNGKNYLLPCLLSHAPIDIVVLMLGTNDLKIRFNLTSSDIALNIFTLINIIQNSSTGLDGKSPVLLLICPPPIGKLTYFKEWFEEATEKSKKLAEKYERIARRCNCYFLDAGKITKSSIIDGIHFDEESHKNLGLSVAEILKKSTRI